MGDLGVDRVERHRLFLHCCAAGQTTPTAVSNLRPDSRPLCIRGARCHRGGVSRSLRPFRHLHVPSWQLGAFVDEYVAAMDLWRQHRRPDGGCALSGLLSFLRAPCGCTADLFQSLLAGTDYRCVGCYRRHHGRLFFSIPLCPDHYLGFLPAPVRSRAGDRISRGLGHHSTVQGNDRPRAGHGLRRRCVVGTPWRIHRRYGRVPALSAAGTRSAPCESSGEKELIGSNVNLSCLLVAVSLGIYCADKNVGPFKNLIVTFSEQSDLLTLNGNVIEKVDQLKRAHWGMNTDIVKAFEKILEVATYNHVLSEDMPETLIIFSDMQFDSCVTGGTAFESLRDRYEQHGYNLPQVIFWNLNARGNNIPVSFHQSGVALVSGFSPSLMKSLLGNTKLNPYQIMDEVIMNDRYKWM